MVIHFESKQDNTCKFKKEKLQKKEFWMGTKRLRFAKNEMCHIGITHICWISSCTKHEVRFGTPKFLGNEGSEQILGSVQGNISTGQGDGTAHVVTLGDYIGSKKNIEK